MKCPNCGYTPPRGRPKELDDKEVFKLRKRGLSFREIGAKLGVTHGAVRKAYLRAKSS